MFYKNNLAYIFKLGIVVDQVCLPNLWYMPHTGSSLEQFNFNVVSVRKNIRHTILTTHQF